MQAIGKVIDAAGGRCVDGGIIGTPPRGSGKMSLYVSGAGAQDLEQFATPPMKVRVLGERVGDASAIKMCYAAMTKGTMAVVLELLIAARKLGVDAALEAEFKAIDGIEVVRRSDKYQLPPVDEKIPQ
jgi:3-hydroxyisobutyrate dehydrogenase-like beta-hydroxyacid dehydrogenase